MISAYTGMTREQILERLIHKEEQVDMMTDQLVKARYLIQTMQARLTSHGL